MKHYLLPVRSTNWKYQWYGSNQQSDCGITINAVEDRDLGTWQVTTIEGIGFYYISILSMHILVTPSLKHVTNNSFLMVLVSSQTGQHWI